MRASHKQRGFVAAMLHRLSGIALPKLICDTPDGKGKVPLGPEVVVAKAAGRATTRAQRRSCTNIRMRGATCSRCSRA